MSKPNIDEILTAISKLENFAEKKAYNKENRFAAVCMASALRWVTGSDSNGFPFQDFVNAFDKDQAIRFPQA